MLRAAIFVALLLPGTAYAQDDHHRHMGGMMDHHMGSMADHSMGAMADHQMGAMHRGVMADQGTSGIPKQPGQGAFAAIQEIVEILEADPHTDWSKVDINALQQHLIDMDNVTLHARVESAP